MAIIDNATNSVAVVVMKRLLALIILGATVAERPVEAREKCLRSGCEEWGRCGTGVRLSSGELVRGRIRDCCRDGVWVVEAEACQARDVDQLWQVDVSGSGSRESSTGTTVSWDLDTTTFDLGLWTPELKLGRSRLRPAFHLGVGRAEAEASLDLDREAFTIFSGTGTLLSAGSEVLFHPFAGSRWSVAAGGNVRTIANSETYHPRVPHFLVSSGLDYRSADAGVAVGYSFFDGRLVPGFGVQLTRSNATIDQFIEGRHAPVKVDLHRKEVVGALDVRFSSSWSAHGEASLGGEKRRGSLSLAWHLGRLERALDQRPRDVRAELLQPWLPPMKTLEQDCLTGIPVCQNTFTQTQSFTGGGPTQELTGTCLLTGETNSVWYIFTAQTTGSLLFTLNTANDYDFALYNVTNAGCVGVPGTAPIRCNYSAQPGTTGLVAPAQAETPALSVPAWGLPTMPGVIVNAGQTYALLVNNFTANQNGYTLTFGGTASIFDTTPPTLQSATINTTSCQIEVVTSEPVLCSSIAANGSDFVLTAPGGASITAATGTGCGQFTNRIRLTYSLDAAESCGNWTITAQGGTDGNTLIDLCNNALVSPDTVTFTTPPAAVPKLTMQASTFCDTATIIADGSASTDERWHFWSVIESDENWIPKGKESHEWFTGQAGTLDVRQFAEKHGSPLQCGRYYRVKLAVNSCCTTWSETVQLIRIQCSPTPEAGPDICCGGTLGTPQGAGSSDWNYLWTPASGLSDPTSPTTTAGPVPGVSSPQTYTLTATDSSGCTATDTARVFCGLPSISINCSGDVCEPTLTAVTANSNDFYWGLYAGTSPSITVGQNMGFLGVAGNPCGQRTAPFQVSSIRRGPFPTLIFPLAFTPNGDGINEVFEIFHYGIDKGDRPAYNATGYRLYVYDRFDSIGSEHLVASAETGDCQGSLYNGQIRWDGRINGNVVQQGAYPWRLELKNCDQDWTSSGLKKRIRTGVKCTKSEPKWYCLWLCEECVSWAYVEEEVDMDTCPSSMGSSCEDVTVNPPL